MISLIILPCQNWGKIEVTIWFIAIYLNITLNSNSINAVSILLLFFQARLHQSSAKRRHASHQRSWAERRPHNRIQHWVSQNAITVQERVNQESTVTEWHILWVNFKQSYTTQLNNITIFSATTKSTLNRYIIPTLIVLIKGQCLITMLPDNFSISKIVVKLCRLSLHRFYI